MSTVPAQQLEESAFTAPCPDCGIQVTQYPSPCCFASDIVTEHHCVAAVSAPRTEQNTDHHDWEPLFRKAS